MKALRKEMDTDVKVLRIGGRSKSVFNLFIMFNLKKLRSKIIEDTKRKPHTASEQEQEPYTASKFLIYHYQELVARKDLKMCLGND